MIWWNALCKCTEWGVSWRTLHVKGLLSFAQDWKNQHGSFLRCEDELVHGATAECSFLHNWLSWKRMQLIRERKLKTKGPWCCIWNTAKLNQLDKSQMKHFWKKTNDLYQSASIIIVTGISFNSVAIKKVVFWQEIVYCDRMFCGCDVFSCLWRKARHLLLSFFVFFNSFVSLN